MDFEVTQLDYVTDRLRGVKTHMKGYITGIVCKYLGHKLYEVELQDYGYYQLWDWQIKKNLSLVEEI